MAKGIESHSNMLTGVSTGRSAKVRSRWLEQKLASMSAERRIATVAITGVLMIVGSLFLRMRVCQFTSKLYPNYADSSWAPFVQAYRELSWTGVFIGMVLLVLAVHHWLSRGTTTVA